MRFSQVRQRQARNGSRRVQSNDVHPQVFSYVDPWDECALGQRYPDDYRGLSGTFTTTFEAQVTTGPGVGIFTDNNQNAVVPDLGTSLFLLTPDPSNVLVQGVVGTQGAAGGQWSGVPNMFAWPNGVLFSTAAGTANAFGPGTGFVNNDNVVSNIVQLRNLFSQARLVSGGGKLAGTMNFSTVSGTVHACPVPVNMQRVTQLNSTIDPRNPTLTEVSNGWQCVLPQNLGDMVNMPGYVETPLASLQTDELMMIYKRYGPEAKLFKPTQSAWGLSDAVGGQLAARFGAASIPDDYGHYCLCVFVSGVQNSTGGAATALTPIMNLQVRLNYECQSSASTSFFFSATNRVYSGQGLLTPAPEFQPLLDAALDNIASDIPAIRNVDDAGMEEVGFIDEVVRLWRGATAVAGSVSMAIEAAGPLLAALSL
jgi:hypothetical protein